MKRKLAIPAAALLFLGTFGLGSALAAPSTSASQAKPVELTGCLQTGPAAKEYLLHTNDGKTWGINEKDMLMNNYVGKTVTVSGDPAHLTSTERKEGAAQHYLLARDIVVEHQSCQK